MAILQAIGQIIQIQQVEAIMLLIVVNFCTGLLAGVLTKTLDWQYIKDINKRIGIMFGLYLVACVPAYFLAANTDSIGWLAIRTAAASALSIYLADKILVNLKEMGLDFLPVTIGLDGKPTSVIRALPGLNRFSKNVQEPVIPVEPTKIA